MLTIDVSFKIRENFSGTHASHKGRRREVQEKRPGAGFQKNSSKCFSRQHIPRNFDQSSETQIHTDASNTVRGAVLDQRPQGTERVTTAAMHSERECIAAVSKFRLYLHRCPFGVVRDHETLFWLANLNGVSGLLSRWSVRLEEFYITVALKSRGAECLSKTPLDSTPSSTHEKEDK